MLDLLAVGGIGIGCIYEIMVTISKRKKELKETKIVETENIVKYEYYPTEEFKEIKIREFNVIKYEYIEGEKEGLKAIVGQNLKGEAITIDILDGHILIGGMTGGGKSNFLNVFITSLMQTYTQNEVFFIGCDYAMSDVYYFRRYEHFKGMSIDKKGFMEQLDWLEKRMNERAIILDRANCRNAIKYNSKNEIKMSYIVFIVDELVQVMHDTTCKTRLHDIMSKCRKYGIYFILGGQDATKEIIGRCKMNCPQVVGFKTFDDTDSDTLIGKGQGLKDINIVGRCKIRNKKGIEEVQIMYIEEEEIEELLLKYEKVRE